jgi:natural product precursor
MKTIKGLKLNNLIKTELKKKELNAIEGGSGRCLCGCVCCCIGNFSEQSTIDGYWIQESFMDTYHYIMA